MLNSDPTSIRIDSNKGQIIFKYQGSEPGIMVLDLRQGTLAGINLKEQANTVIQLSELLKYLGVKDDGINFKDKLYMFGKKITNIFGANDQRPPQPRVALSLTENEEEEQYEEVYLMTTQYYWKDIDRIQKELSDLINDLARGVPVLDHTHDSRYSMLDHEHSEDALKMHEHELLPYFYSIQDIGNI